MKQFLLTVLLFTTIVSFAQNQLSTPVTNQKNEVDVPNYPGLKQRFYSTSEGKESNDGLTEKTPKVLPQFLWDDVTSSYHIRLKRGDVFPKAIIGDKNFNTRQIVISSYGTGAKPVIDLLKTATKWAKQATNIWKISLAITSTDYTGYRHPDNSQNVNVGFLKVGDEIYGNRVYSQSALTQQWQFYCANSTLYIYSTTQPSANAVRFSACHAGVTLSQNMHVYNIKVLGAGDHGFNGDKQNQVLKNIKVKGCEAVSIGGCVLPGYGDGTTRYGNGYQLYKGGEDCEFTNNYAEQCFDVAYTLQSNNAVWKNIIFDGNKSDKCNQDIEVWTDKTISYTNVRFRNGVHIGAGYCWGNSYRRQGTNDPDNKVGVSVLMYGGSKVSASDCIIENNEFAGAKDGYITWTTNGGNLTTRNNKVTLPPGQCITSAAYGQINNKAWVNTAEGVAIFKTATGKDAGTIFNVTDLATTPIVPTLTANDTANTLTASHALGNSEILVSENNEDYQAYAGLINVGNVARAAGFWKFKIKAATGRNESSIVSSPLYLADQTISFAPISDAVLGESPFTLSATASSGLLVNYKIVLGDATLSGSKLTVSGAGTVVIEANQSGNESFNAAIPVRQTFTVNQAAKSAACSATGSITYERWNKVNGVQVDNIPLNTSPTITKEINQLEYKNTGYTYGVRIRGYVCPPQSGNYTFWIAGDDAAELWLSTDDDTANKVKIAYVTKYTEFREWSKYSTQKSVQIALKANKKYYIEVLHKQNGQNDHLSVAWQLPNGVTEVPMDGSRLSPYIVNKSASRALPQDLTVETDKEKDLVALKVYPNPVRDIATVEVDFNQSQSQHAKIEVFDFYGKRVTTLFEGIIENANQKKFSFQANKLAPGVYFVRFTGNNISLNQKIILVR